MNVLCVMYRQSLLVYDMHTTVSHATSDHAHTMHIAMHGTPDNAHIMHTTDNSLHIIHK